MKRFIEGEHRGQSARLPESLTMWRTPTRYGRSMFSSMNSTLASCPIMLFAPTLADRAILPTAWGGRYFFNRIGQKRTIGWQVGIAMLLGLGEITRGLRKPA